MKKIILSLITFVTMFVLSGCVGGTSTTGLSKNGGKYYLWERSNGDFAIHPLNSGLSLKEELRIAAETVKSKGYSKFVILNSGVSNLEGFPINTSPELERYVTLKKRKPSFQTNGRNQSRGKYPLKISSDRYSDSFQLWFKSVGNEFDGTYISTWDVEQTLRDTM